MRNLFTFIFVFVSIILRLYYEGLTEDEETVEVMVIPGCKENGIGQEDCKGEQWK